MRVDLSCQPRVGGLLSLCRRLIAEKLSVEPRTLAEMRETVPLAVERSLPLLVLLTCSNVSAANDAPRYQVITRFAIVH